MSTPFRFQYGKEFIKSGVVEEVLFETEVHEVPRGRDYWDVAKIKFLNDTMLYRLYHAKIIMDFGVERLKGQKIRFAARGNTIFGIVIDKKKLYYVSDSKKTFFWGLALILFIIDIILIRNNKKISLF